MSLVPENRIDKLLSLLENLNLDAILLTSSSSIKCISGYFYSFEIGDSPFQLLPAALLITSKQNMNLIIADNEDPVFDKTIDILEIIPYPSYRYKESLDYENHFNLKLGELIRKNNLLSERIGIESNSLPYTISSFLLNSFSNISLIDITGEITKLKAVKDDDEIENIRNATALCDIGQKAVLKYAEVGLSELELFSMIRTEMEASVGTRLPIMLDLVSGKRTSEGGGIPSNKRIKEGDLILSDLTPCLNGYWGDTCNTIVVGEPTLEQRKHFILIEEALKLALYYIKPGITANTVDNLLRVHLKSVGEYDHHSGHGVGTSNHEEPRIVPYNKMVLEKNMVIALEPAIYTNEYGIRLEHLILVTETGCETISKFKHCFEQV